MTHRSLLVGPTPIVVIRAGGSVTVEGWPSDRIQADTDGRWGLQIERRKAADVGRNRARAKVGDRVLFDVAFDVPFDRSRRMKRNLEGDAVEVQLDGDGQVRVPLGADLTVYAGRSAEVRHFQGRVTTTAGRDLSLSDVQVLVHAAAGGDLNIDCAALQGEEFRFTAGRDLRFYVHDLADAKLMIRDLGGYWEAILGTGRLSVWLKAGGDVTLVTDLQVKAQPPHYLLGNIERPAPPESSSMTAAETTSPT